MLNFTILGFLNFRSMTGYDIKQLMESSTNHFWDARLSQIYMTLKKLEQAGWVESVIEAQDGRPDRRVYTITSVGKAELDSWLGKLILERDTKKDPLLLKIFFSSPEDAAMLISQLRLQLELHQEQLRVYEEDSQAVIADFIADKPDLTPHVKLWELTRRFGISYEKTYIQWLQEAIQLLEEE